MARNKLTRRFVDESYLLKHIWKLAWADLEDITVGFHLYGWDTTPFIKGDR